MQPAHTDRAFSGSIPQLYERYLVPLIFEPYALDMADRVVALAPSRVLEIAAGTGVVTRRMAAGLPSSTSIVATDLNQPMLDHAASLGTARPVEWGQADAMQLPFPDQAFDVVVCQFGVMFFPDKAVALAEARRVLRPGGTLLFNVWDRIEANDFAATVTDALASLFRQQPPRFLARTPHGHSDTAVLAGHVARGGFTAAPSFETVTRSSRAGSPQLPAMAYCQGTPLRNEIEALDPSRLQEATDAATQAIAQRYGAGTVEGRIQAIVATVQR